MKHFSRYNIKVEDESHLTEVTSLSVTVPGLIAAGLAAGLVLLFAAGLIISLTPLRTLLPGYLKESERSATEEGLLRLDSLMRIYEQNDAYIANIMKLTDHTRIPDDSAAVAPVSRELSSDSLMNATPGEQRFMSQMEERERFNISVLAPLAADGLMFSPVCSEGVFTEASHKSVEGEIVMPRDASVQCAADGTIVALYYSAPIHGFVIVTQHGRGFVTSYTHTGTPLVSVGDIVNSGQAIALAPGPDSKGVRSISVRIWHNGYALTPYDYLSSALSSKKARALHYEAPRDRE